MCAAGLSDASLPSVLRTRTQFLRVLIGTLLLCSAPSVDASNGDPTGLRSPPGAALATAAAYFQQRPSRGSMPVPSSARSLTSAGGCGVWAGAANRPHETRPATGAFLPFDPDPVLHELYGSAFDAHTQTGSDEVVVLGMHNSGTSITTRFLMLMGAFAGNRDEIVVDPRNRLKLYERSDLMAFHDRFLFSHTDNRFAGWHAQSYNLRNLSTPAVAQLHKAAARALASVRRHSPAVLKDPRMCLTLDLWKPLLRSPFCVIVAADSSRIAQRLGDSPKVFNHLTLEKVMTPERFMVTWEAMLFHAVRSCVGVPTMLFDTEGLRIDNVFEHVRRLYDGVTYLGVQGLQMPSEADVDARIVAYFSTSHAHSRPGDPILRAPMTQRQHSLEKALNHFTAEALAAPCGFDPTRVAQQVLDFARQDMGEELWRALEEQYPAPDLRNL